MTSATSAASLSSNRRRTDDSVRAADLWATWIGHFLLFMICFGTTFNLTLRNTDAEFETDTLVFMRLAICGACGLYGAWYLARTVGRLLTFPSAIYVLFVGWSLLSVAKAESKVYALAAVVTLICVVLFVPAALLRLGARPFLTTALVSLTLFAFLSWVLFFLMPEIGAYHEAGDTGTARVGQDANQLGFQCALGLTITGAMWLKRWLPTWTMLTLVVFFSVTLLATDSRTSMASALLAATLLGYRWLDWSGRFFVGAIVSALAAVVLLTAPPNVTEVARSSARSGDLLEIYSLNGRTEIWAYALEQSRKSLLLGHGYGASRFALSEYTNAGYNYDELHHTHNQIINTLLTTGIPGMLLVIAMGLYQFYMAWRQPSLVADALSLVIVAAGLLEVVLFGPMPRVAVILWFTAVHWRTIELSGENEERQSWPTKPLASVAVLPVSAHSGTTVADSFRSRSEEASP